MKGKSVLKIGELGHEKGKFSISTHSNALKNPHDCINVDYCHWIYLQIF